MAREFIVIPNVVSATASDSPTADNASLLFVGNLNYLPNIDALTYPKAEVLPHLQRLVPDVHVDVVGRSPASDSARAAVARLAEGGRLRFTFDVPDCGPHYARCAAVIAPIRIGGGTRIKIIEAFAHGRPVVSTTKGCEGLAVTHAKELMIADGPRDFATACAELLRDQTESLRITAAARQHYEREHSQSLVDAKLRETIDGLFAT